MASASNVASTRVAAIATRTMIKRATVGLLRRMTSIPAMQHSPDLSWWQYPGGGETSRLGEAVVAAADLAWITALRRR